MGLLDGKIAIVTGASSGIGAGIAEMFVAEGASVAMAARRTDRLEEKARRLGPKSLAVRTDVTVEADIIALFDATEKAFGVPHIVVNCAGYADHTPTDELTFEAWNKIIATNLVMRSHWLKITIFSSGMASISSKIFCSSSNFVW